MNVFILGADGYVGWPLSVSLAIRYPEHSFFMLDNLSRRKLVKKVGSDSLLPILSPKKRIQNFKKIFQQSNLSFIELNILDQKLKHLIQEKKPGVIYHLAQQPSAHYSMKGVEESVYTIRNNEEGNLRLLWLIKENIPNTHLVKLGSFGEYAECGLDIPEGYFYPEYKNKKAVRTTHFPREADDVYHISKINDTNFISMACRKWGLIITDIMQSTIFGTHINAFQDKEILCTRFDYDEFFGTVINRFLVQALLGIPLTIYGTGNQRTGLMALEDAVSSLTHIFEKPPERGIHRVINHVVEKDHSVNEIAELVQKAAHKKGMKISISNGKFDPRSEKLERKKNYKIEAEYLRKNIQSSDIESVISNALQYLQKYKDRARQNIINPSFKW